MHAQQDGLSGATIITRDDLKQNAIAAIGFIAAYLCADAATHVLVDGTSAATPWNPEAGLAIVFTALTGVWTAPIVGAAVALADVLVRGADIGALATWLGAVAVTAVYATAGGILRRWTEWDSEVVGLRDLSLFGATAFSASVMAALVRGVYLLWTGTAGAQNPQLLMLQIFIGDLLGIVVVVPPILLTAAGTWRRVLATRTEQLAAWRHGILFVGVLATVLVARFAVRPLDEFRVSYLLFLPVLAVCMRYGLLGAAMAAPLVQVGLLASLTIWVTRAATFYEFQLLMLTLAITALCLGAIVDERARAVRRASQREKELREQHEVLTEAQRTASAAELATALAHELNQPLSALGTYARAARLTADRDTTDRSQLLGILERIVEESARAAQQVRRLREFFRADSIDVHAVDVGNLIDSAHAYMRDRLEDERIQWRCHIETGIPRVHVDPVKISAILGNLLRNASDALSSVRGDRLITVCAELIRSESESRVRITVSDNGAGIAPAVRSQLFKPLATTKPEGMGLGLALSRSIAERQGCRLWFDETNSTTTFCLDLPIHD